MNPDSGLLGSSAFEEAKINEWISWAQLEWIPKMHVPLMQVLGKGQPDPSNKIYNEGLKVLKELAKVLNTNLEGKNFIVGDKISIADIYLASMFVLVFQTMFDEGFRGAMKNLTRWFKGFIDHQSVI